MKEIETSEELKKIGLDILLSVHGFCESHQIKYSLACGTLIGAVRHKGFIPWDDDVDIYMLREDYNKFIEMYRGTNDRYEVISLETSKKWKLPWAKVYDKQTLLIEKANTNVENIGFGIDVFPLDSAPDSYEEWERYEKKRVLFQRAFAIKKMVWRKGRSLRKNLFLYTMKALMAPISMRCFAEFINNYSQKYNNNSTSFLAENCFGTPNNRFSKNDFTKVIDISFENHNLKAMNGYDNYLRAFYGDYMKLPPIDQRCTHHNIKLYYLT